MVYIDARFLSNIGRFLSKSEDKSLHISYMDFAVY